MAGLCETCDGCCRVFEVKPINKAFGEPCRYIGNTLAGHGCTIYAERPDVCQRYICLWLDSQRRPNTEKMPESLRPDVTHVVMGWPFGQDRETMFVYPYPGYEQAWRVPPISDHLRMILSRGGKIVVVTGETRIALRGDMAVIGTEEEFSKFLQ